MPKVATVPLTIRPFVFHGVNIRVVEGSSQAVGDCPWCGREDKFSIRVEDGRWKCWVCQAGNDKGGGNIITFLRMLWTESDKATNGATAELARDRKFLYPETLTYWSVCQSITTRDWLVPGYSMDGKLNQLYRYILMDPTTNKRKLLPTPGLRHQIHGLNLFDHSKGISYICEGPWDGMALWEVLRSAKQTGDGLALTGSESSSLLADANVVAVPGCGSVGEPFVKWLPLFAGKKVILMFDSDHPREHNGKVVEPAGYAATKRAVQLFSRAEELPKEVHYLKWGPDGYDESLSSGFDIRDWLTTDRTPAYRVTYLLPRLLKKVALVPASWVAPGTTTTTSTPAKDGNVELNCLRCTEWKTLIPAWRKAMHWTEGLDRALSVMLACIASTRAVGAGQLWCKIIGPASCGKSTLCEALSVNKKYILAKSTITGFHSGWRSDRQGKEDNSLLSQLYDKTLITKDGDTLLQAPNLRQILSELRDVYDGTSRSYYRNQMGKDYQGLRITVILCGTNALREIDHSEVGERFFDCVIMEGIDDELENEVLLRVAYRARDTMAYEADGNLTTQHDPDLVKAMQLTGGYVGYLRTNAQRLLSSVIVSDEALQQCTHLGKFVAYMRARPSAKQEEAAEREFGARLVEQHVRLAMALAVVLNRPEIDDEVMRRVTRVALDTARGRTLEIIRHLYVAGQGGADTCTLAQLTNESKEKEYLLLCFLRKIGAVTTYSRKVGLGTRSYWRLTGQLRGLYKEVF